MKIIFMGSPDFAVPALSKIFESKYQIVAIYCQKPKPANRGMAIKKCAVHEAAEKFGLKVITPDSLRTLEAQQEFRDLKADVAVVAAYGMLLPKEILEGTKHGCINIHPSLLPRWRGAAPIQRAVMAGDTKTAMCIMQMNEGLDTGDIILQKEFAIGEHDTAGTMHDMLAVAGAEMTLEVIDKIEAGTAKRTPQSNEGVVYAHKLKKEDEVIDFKKSAFEVLNQIRGLSPYPVANFMLEGVKYKIHEAEILPTSGVKKLECGEIVVENGKLIIGCAVSAVAPKIIQKEGKRAMSVAEFLNGNSISSKKII